MRPSGWCPPEPDYGHGVGHGGFWENPDRQDLFRALKEDFDVLRNRKGAELMRRSEEERLTSVTRQPAVKGPPVRFTGDAYIERVAHGKRRVSAGHARASRSRRAERLTRAHHRPAL